MLTYDRVPGETPDAEDKEVGYQNFKRQMRRYLRNARSLALPGESKPANQRVRDPQVEQYARSVLGLDSQHYSRFLGRDAGDVNVITPHPAKQPQQPTKRPTDLSSQTAVPTSPREQRRQLDEVVEQTIRSARNVLDAIRHRDDQGRAKSFELLEKAGKLLDATFGPLERQRGLRVEDLSGDGAEQELLRACLDHARHPCWANATKIQKALAELGAVA
jgi:hypothetical protein